MITRHCNVISSAMSKRAFLIPSLNETWCIECAFCLGKFGTRKNLPWLWWGQNILQIERSRLTRHLAAMIYVKLQDLSLFISRRTPQQPHPKNLNRGNGCCDHSFKKSFNSLNGNVYQDVIFFNKLAQISTLALLALVFSLIWFLSILGLISKLINVLEDVDF